MVRTLNNTPEEAMQGNLNTWCLEVGSEYEKYSRQSAEKLIKYIGTKPVVDLGAGDGAGTKRFVENGNPVTAVDINADKLNRIEGAMTVEQDIVSYLDQPLENIFMHHVLEHIPNWEEVLYLISEHLKKGRYCLIAVPKDDTPHSVHYVAFDSWGEIAPEGLELIEHWETSDSAIWQEYGIIARKS